jgi:hypothetical protein
MMIVVVVVVVLYTVETSFTICQFKVLFHLIFGCMVLKAVISMLNFLQFRLDSRFSQQCG